MKEEKFVSQKDENLVCALSDKSTTDSPSTLGVPYKNPASATNQEYPIIAYNNVRFPNGENTSIDEVRILLQTVKDCGFNVNLWDCGNAEYEGLLNKNYCCPIKLFEAR